MRIDLCSIIVQDQEAALYFYTEVLGFSKKLDLPAGEFRWLTLVSSEDLAGVQLVLEPNAHPASASYQRSLFEAGIPLTSFATANLDQEYETLRARGVKFRMPPTDSGDSRLAQFEDTCGNIIQLHQARAS